MVRATHLQKSVQSWPDYYRSQQPTTHWRTTVGLCWDNACSSPFFGFHSNLEFDWLKSSVNWSRSCSTNSVYLDSGVYMLWFWCVLLWSVRAPLLSTSIGVLQHYIYFCTKKCTLIEDSKTYGARKFKNSSLLMGVILQNTPNLSTVRSPKTFIDRLNTNYPAF